MTPHILVSPLVGLSSHAAAAIAPTTGLGLVQRSLQEGGTEIVFETDDGGQLKCIYFGEGSDILGEVIISEGEELEEVRAIISTEGDVTSLTVGGTQVYGDDGTATETTSAGQGVSRRAQEEDECNKEECEEKSNSLLDALAGLIDRISGSVEFGTRVEFKINEAKEKVESTCEDHCPPGESSCLPPLHVKSMMNTLTDSVETVAA